jgi:TonB family protein
VLVVVLIGSLGAQEAQDKGELSTGEYVVRKRAIIHPVPRFPDEALRLGIKGIVVAEIHVNQLGSVKQVNILEAPSALLSNSVSEALRRWQFEPAKIKNEPRSFEGKLFFYFVINGSIGQVLTPQQAVEQGVKFLRNPDAVAMEVKLP